MNRRVYAYGRRAIALAFLLGVGVSRAADPHVQRIGPTRGLLAGEISAVTQDRVGLLWLGTREGLLLYDGYEFRIFERDPDQEDSLADNWIRVILEDREGRLWIGTNGGGLDLLDRASWKFIHHRRDPNDSGSIVDNGVFALLQDRHGTIWVGTRKGLVRFDPQGDRFEVPDVNGWVLDLLEDASGGIWVATFGGGVFHRAPDGKGFQSVPMHDPPAEWRPQRARCLAQDSHGAVWAGVAGGLLRFDGEEKAFHPTAIPIGPGAPEGLPTASDLAAAPDGTLNQLRADADLFTIHRAPPDGQDFGFASAVIEDEAERVWLASFGLGIQILDLRTGSAFPSEISRSSDTGERAVTVLFPSGDGGAWVGTPVGLARLDRRGDLERWWKPDPLDPAALGPGYVTAVLETRDGTVWAGTGGSGLFRMLADGSGFEGYPVADGFVSLLRESDDGTVWIGTRSSGISLIPPGLSEPRAYLQDPDDLAVLARQGVSSILEDRRGRLWVGTLGGGLFRIDRTGGRVRVSRFGEAEGLVDQNVAGVLEDDDGTIWISTRRGLSRLDPATGIFATRGLDDGLPSPTFNVGCAWRGPKWLHFGTNQGLVAIRTGTPFPSPDPSPVALVSLRTLAGPVRADRPVWDVDSISIGYGEVLFVDFAVLDFRGADRHRFAYRLGSDTSDWIDVGNRRALTFTDLDPGAHVLHVRGRNANGVWGETGHPIRIEVIPPFWMTWWFQLAAIGLVVGAAWTGHRVRTVALERRNLVLEALQREKQKALDEAHESQRALNETYGRLRTLTRRLEDAKEDERRNIARELHDEMGQALSATKINLKALGRLADGPERGERLEDTLTLVDGMIHHVRTLSLDLRPPLLEELGLVASLRTYAEGQSLRTGVGIGVEANADALDVPADIDIAAFRIVQEAVNNVLRHAGANRVTVSVRRDPDRLSLAITDDGRGFDLSEALRRVARASPKTRVVILSMHAGEAYVAQALRAGVAGYLLKDAADDELALALKAVGRGDVYLSPQISRQLVDRYAQAAATEPDPLAGLTSRQREILQLVAEGRSSKEIAGLLKLSIKTVESHRGQIMERIGVHDVTGLVRFAIRVGLISPEA